MSLISTGTATGTRPGNDVRPDIRIERMAADDLDAVMTIEQASFSVPWSRRIFLTELTAPPFSCLYVARPMAEQIVNRIPARTPDSMVIGYLCCWIICDEMHLLNLAVHPDSRRQGIGEALLRCALAHSRREGATVATLEVRASNRAAQRVYERAGFGVIAFRPRYYTNPGEDAVIMSCLL